MFDYDLVVEWFEYIEACCKDIRIEMLAHQILGIVINLYVIMLQCALDISRLVFFV